MGYQCDTQRSRITKAVPPSGRRRCGCCSPRSLSPRVSYSTALAISGGRAAPISVRTVFPTDIIPVEPAPGPVSLETARNLSHDGTTEDASVQWRMSAVEGEIHDLNSVRVISPTGDITPPPFGDVSGDDSLSHLLPIVNYGGRRVIDCDPQREAFTRSISQPSCLIRMSLHCTRGLAS